MSTATSPNTNDRPEALTVGGCVCQTNVIVGLFEWGALSSCRCVDVSLKVESGAAGHGNRSLPKVSRLAQARLRFLMLLLLPRLDTAMTIAGKQLIGRARPPLADAVPPYEYSPSFPSGHSLNALVIAGIVAYLLLLRQRRRGSRVLTVTVAALFAFQRR